MDTSLKLAVFIVVTNVLAIHTSVEQTAVQGQPVVQDGNQSPCLQASGDTISGRAIGIMTADDNSSPTQNSSCQWSLEADAGEILLARIESFQFGPSSGSQLNLTVIVDGSVTIIISVDNYEEATKHVGRQFTGRTLQLTWTSLDRGPRSTVVGSGGENYTRSSSNTRDQGPGQVSASFELRYATFSQDFCQVPDDLENVVVEGGRIKLEHNMRIVNVHDTIEYTCIGTSPPPIVVRSKCILEFDEITKGKINGTNVTNNSDKTYRKPSWSHPPPICSRHQNSCSNSKDVDKKLPIVKVLLPRMASGSSNEYNNSRTILAYEGRLGRIDNGGCIWQVQTSGEGSDGFVGVVVERFQVELPPDDNNDADDYTQTLSLEIYDGEIRDSRLLRRFSRRVGGRKTAKMADDDSLDNMPASFVSIHGKFFIVLNRTSSNDVHNVHGNNANVTYDFYARFTTYSMPGVCKPFPNAPTNGDVKGSEVVHDTTRMTTAAVTAIFGCNDGYNLVGSDRAECIVDAAGWNAPVKPICEPILSAGGQESIDVLTGADKTVARMPQQPRLSRPHPQSTEEKSYKKSPQAKDSTEIVAAKAPQNVDIIQGSVVTVLSTVLPMPVDESEFQPENEGVDGLLEQVDQEYSDKNFKEDDDDDLLSFSGDPDPNWRTGNGGQRDYENSLSGGYSELDNNDEEYKEDHEMFENSRRERGKEKDHLGEGEPLFYNSFPVTIVVMAATIPILLCIVLLASCLVYRKLYPVRMGPGRRFETFENPIYGQPGKRGSTMSGVGGGGGQRHEVNRTTLASPEKLAQSPAELERLTTTTTTTTATINIGT